MGGFIRGIHFNDFYEYDPISNTWLTLKSYDGGSRVCPSGFVIGNKLYIGNGRNNANHFRDWWMYQKQPNSWAQINNFPEDYSYSTTAFSIGNKAYCGLGSSNLSGLTYSNRLFSFSDTIIPPAVYSPALESYHIFGTRNIVFKNVQSAFQYSLIDATGRFIVKNKTIAKNSTETLPFISSAVYIVRVEGRFSYKLFYPPDIAP